MFYDIQKPFQIAHNLQKTLVKSIRFWSQNLFQLSGINSANEDKKYTVIFRAKF